MLVARRRLHRGDDLAGDAQLGEVAEARLAIGAVVADRLVQADEALLDEVVAVAAGEEVRRRLQADEPVVAADEPLVRRRVALLGQGDEIAIIDLDLRLSVGGETGHERSFLPRRGHDLPANGIDWVLSGALLPWRQLHTTTAIRRRSQAQLERQVARLYFRLMERCQAESRECKIPYSSAAAAALTFSEPIRPRIGSATSPSQAPATRGRSPAPLRAEHEHCAAAPVGLGVRHGARPRPRRRTTTHRRHAPRAGSPRGCARARSRGARPRPPTPLRPPPSPARRAARR